MSGSQILTTRLLQEAQSMAQQLQTIDESASYGQVTWTLTLVLNKQPCACCSSKSLVSAKAVNMTIHSKTLSGTPVSIERSLQS